MSTNSTHHTPLFFVVGYSRSGTTLMGQILGLNSEVFTFEEMHFFEQLWSQEDRLSNLSEEKSQSLAARLLAIQDRDFLTYADPELYREEANGIISRMNQENLTAESVFEAFLVAKAKEKGASIPCEQTPRNVLYLQEILDLYPHSYVINMVRDPRDILLSQKNKWRIRFLGAKNIPYQEAFRSWANYHPVTIAKLWNAAINTGNKFADHPRVKTVKFEDLVTQPDEVLKSVCEFLGLEFQSQMLAVPQDEGGVSSHKKINSKQKGIDPKVTGKWKLGGLSRAEISLCEKMTHKNMDRYHYSPSLAEVNTVFLVAAWLSLPGKLSLALLLNLHRTRNLWEAIKRRM